VASEDERTPVRKGKHVVKKLLTADQGKEEEFNRRLTQIFADKESESHRRDAENYS
jgi:hypothetical protein